MIYADIIVDISHENLDKIYQYAVPNELEEQVVVGTFVEIPFGKGNRTIKGYIVELSEVPKYPVEKTKYILGIVKNSLIIETHLIRLAYWIKDNYGGTMIDALKTVVPVKRSVKKKEKKYISLLISYEEGKKQLEYFKRKNNKARVRLLEALLEEETLDYDMIVERFHIARSTIQALEELGFIKIIREQTYRNPIQTEQQKKYQISLNTEQRAITEAIKQEYRKQIRNIYLIHGITGSGKTEVYMEVIEEVIQNRKQVIMLIPEIALTFQTVMRFYKRFGDRISILHSRLSAGEKYDQYLRAKRGLIDIMIGPRSALFTPFEQLGLIIIDEEHESSYKSETLPKYHAREVAIERAKMVGASVILGSATPSVESYKKAKEGKYQLFTLKKRAGAGNLPTVWVVDLREELKKRNKSIFSEKLKELIENRLKRKEQTILFINRRGYAGFVSCRSCGHVMKCPHCDVSLTSHNNGKLICHYCGHEEDLPQQCPSCNSKYIAAFGTGTQKVEAMIKKEFPQAKVLRMDADTTSKKGDHEKILSAFANQEADILVGTQMIVKGHDFPMVTLVGIIAADLSLYASDFRAAERTFQLLAQAAGRAGRAKLPGEVVIQTYNPENYSIQMAKNEDYEHFYEEEMTFRSIMAYPPIEHMLLILVSARKEEQCHFAAQMLFGALKEENMEKELQILGPSKASVAKINDIHRRILYIKHKDYEMLKAVKNYLEGFVDYSEQFKNVSVQFDFDPIQGY